MKKKFKFGVIGAGFMSSAIISGAISSKVLKPKQIIVSDVKDESLDIISKKGVFVTKDNRYLCENAEFVLFAVKPQNLSEVLQQIKDCECDKFISIMAGIKKDRIKQIFKSSKIARCMPNTPCSIGYGAVGIDLSDYTDEKDITFIKSLFSSFAEVVVVAEDKLNAVTGVSGSGPAYFYLFLKSIIDAGVKNGLTEQDAKNLAVNTMIGAGFMVKNNKDKTIDELINAVCSKGGTTIEAINTFKGLNLLEISQKAVDACVKRSTELENL